MVDPDAPSPHDPKFRNWLHWMVINIPGAQADMDITIQNLSFSCRPRLSESGEWRAGIDTQRGDVIVDYMGPVGAPALALQPFFLSFACVCLLLRHGARPRMCWHAEPVQGQAPLRVPAVQAGAPQLACLRLWDTHYEPLLISPCAP